jgi:ribosomal protein L19
MIKQNNTNAHLKKLIEDEARANAEKEMFLKNLNVGDKVKVELEDSEEEKKRLKELLKRMK